MAGDTDIASIVPAPQQLSKYKLLEEIGHGGMATVYRAHDTRLDREVALKLIHRHLRQSDEIEARFNSEARAVAKLRHPNIVEVYDVSDPEDEERYLIVELVRGVTLRQLLARRGALPVELAAEVVLELAAALEHAHGMGVIHRDIKPENVLVEEQPAKGTPNHEDWERPRIKLTDFGIAKLLDAQGVTSTGQVLGSPAHMAPEQIEGRPVDVRSDVFSLGVLFYETVVGSLPFSGKNPAQVLRNVLDGNFDPPDRARPEVGARWSRLITEALSREPDGRPRTIEEFATRIRDELTLTGFKTHREDIARYLTGPDEYIRQFPERIARCLSASGRRALARRDRVLATEQFSRALAYRPGDPALLRQVSGLRRREQLRVVGQKIAVGLLIVAVPAGVVWLWPKRTVPIIEDSKPITSVVPLPVRPDLELPKTTEVRRVEPAAPRTPPAAKAPPAKTRKYIRPLPEPEEPEPEIRGVVITVQGAQGGSVRIDGEDKNWFGGVVHQLTVGEHTFEFVPPNENCCVAVTKVVRVEPGEGLQRVIGRIRFKDSGLGVSDAASRGWKMSCPTLFSDSLALPGQRSVPMSQATAEGACTFIDTVRGSEPRQKTVTLSAGQVLALPWPP